MPAVPFKLNQDRRHHIPRQQHKVTNWPAYEASLHQRGSLTMRFADDAIAAWAKLAKVPRAPRVECQRREQNRGRREAASRRAKVEAAIGRWKQVVGDGLSSRIDARRATEVEVAVHVLNRMSALERPTYVRIV
jgi:hypothetical protein